METLEERLSKVEDYIDERVKISHRNAGEIVKIRVAVQNLTHVIEKGQKERRAEHKELISVLKNIERSLSPDKSEDE